jgi:hypothetical protein
VDVVENVGRGAEWIWSRIWEIPHTTLEGHSLFVGDFEAFDRTRYGQISPRALLPPPGTERGVDVVENVGRAKDPEKAKDEQAREHDRNAGQERGTGTTVTTASPKRSVGGVRGKR